MKLKTLLAICAALTLFSINVFSQSTGFTYQGQLKVGGSPATGYYDFVCYLYDASSAGTQIGSFTLNQNVPVTNGLFTITLDFGTAPFTNADRYLEITVRPYNTGGYQTLAPRQKLTPAPFAIHSKISDALTLPYTPSVSYPGSLMSITNTNGGNYVNLADPFFGLYAYQATGSTAHGGVVGFSALNNGNGVFGQANVGGSAYGVEGSSTSGYGVFGNGGVAGGYFTSSNIGLLVNSFATSFNYAIKATAANGYGVYATGSNGGIDAVGGTYGVYATGFDGVYGSTSTSNSSAAGVYGASGTAFAAGVIGSNTASGNAGVFYGDVQIFGTMHASGKMFRIDHPLDPANKYLNHACVESSEMKNIYDGVTQLDAQGEAVVSMPDWFEALNKDFRYQLTSIGAPGPNLYIAEELANGQFKISGGTPNAKVSWQITGNRQDAYAKAHPIKVEEDKAGGDKGTYLAPKEHGMPEASGVQAKMERDLAHQSAVPIKVEKPVVKK